MRRRLLGSVTQNAPVDRHALRDSGGQLLHADVVNSFAPISSLRQQLALDYDPAVLPHNGEVIDADDTPAVKGRKAKA